MLFAAIFFQPYTVRDWLNQKIYNHEEDVENAHEFLQIASNNVSGYGEEISEFYEDRITLRQKSKKYVYSIQDLYNIYRNMENSEIPDTLLRKLVTLKVRLFYLFLIYSFICRFQSGNNCIDSS